MPSKRIPLVVDEKYHIFNRGVDKRVIFDDDQDYLRFYKSLEIFNIVEPVTNFQEALRLSKEKVKREPLVALHSFCLLPNHFHLVLTQCVENGISTYLKRIAGGYSAYYNQKNDRAGTLFQGPFKRVHINSNKQLVYLLAYVNENYIVHGIREPQRLPVSSARIFRSKNKNTFLDIEHLLRLYSENDARSLAASIRDRRKDQKSLDHLEYDQ